MAKLCELTPLQSELSSQFNRQDANRGTGQIALMGTWRQIQK